MRWHLKLNPIVYKYMGKEENLIPVKIETKFSYNEWCI